MTHLLAAMAAGALLGWQFPGIADYAAPLANSFLRLVQSVIAPVLFTTLVASFARGGKPSELGRIGAKSLVWFEASTTLAMLIGWVVVTMLRPGDGVGLRGTAQAANAPNFAAVVESMFPSSIVSAMARGDVLQIVLFSVALGLACAAIGPRAEVFVRFCESASQIALQYTRFVMKFAAIGIAAAMASAVGANGAGILVGLGKFVAAAWLAQLLFTALGVIVPLLFLRIPLARFWQFMREPFFIAFGTTSSAAAIPSTLTQLERYGIPPALASLTMPLGISFNPCGSALHLVMASFFVAQAAGVSLTMPQQLMILLTLKLTSKGVAGIPRANFVILSSLFPAYGLPLEGLAVLLGVDAFIDTIRTGNNILANCVAPAAIARWEGWRPTAAPESDAYGAPDGRQA
ncbi:MAG: dicarboxylate/amino acid:cation symporter [Acidobacteria bacterium]|nr:dicarboxylate/amino acid:cation symporter [Acidobacteriota bacterium]